jgi:glutathione S-transferase
MKARIDGRLTLYGANYSVYVRIARLVLEELGLAHERISIDIFADTDAAGAYRSIHPFGKIPALDHDGWRVYETDAIAHYLIALLGGSPLLPDAPRQRARTVQITRIADNYAYPRLVWDIYVAESEAGASAEMLQPALARARTVLDTLDELAHEPFLLGPALTLADLWLYPMLEKFALAPSGQAMLGGYPRLVAWMSHMAARPCVLATETAPAS